MALILDAKRGDIGSTAEHYAREAFSRYGAHAVTVNPYLGGDSVVPFFALGGAVIALCRTSNPGSADLQSLDCGGEPLYVRVARMVADEWVRHGECGLVVGATFPSELAAVREVVGDLPILVPGVGAQRGDAAAAVRAGATSDGRGLDREQLAIDPLRVVGRRLRGRRPGRHDRGPRRAHTVIATTRTLSDPNLHRGSTPSFGTSGTEPTTTGRRICGRYARSVRAFSAPAYPRSPTSTRSPNRSRARSAVWFAPRRC